MSRCRKNLYGKNLNAKHLFCHCGSWPCMLVSAELCFTLQGCPHLWNTNLGLPQSYYEAIYLQIPGMSRVQINQIIMSQAVLGLMTTPVEGRRLSKGTSPEKYDVLDRCPASASCHAVLLFPDILGLGVGHAKDTCWASCTPWGGKGIVLTAEAQGCRAKHCF